MDGLSKAAVNVGQRSARKKTEPAGMVPHDISAVFVALAGEAPVCLLVIRHQMFG
jgi:hypothetical protein